MHKQQISIFFIFNVYKDSSTIFIFISKLNDLANRKLKSKPAKFSNWRSLDFPQLEAQNSFGVKCRDYITTHSLPVKLLRIRWEVSRVSIFPLEQDIYSSHLAIIRLVLGQTCASIITYPAVLHSLHSDNISSCTDVAYFTHTFGRG